MTDRNRVRWTQFFSMVAIAALCGTTIASGASAQSQPEEQAIASPAQEPPLAQIELSDLDGASIRMSQLVGRPRVLILGELNHARTLRACDELASLLDAPILSESNATTVLIVTRSDSRTKAGAPNEEHKLPDQILLDAERRAFGALGVIVMPTLVVLDEEGQVVHSMPGFLPRMQEIIVSAVRLASGELTRAEFDYVLAAPQEEQPSDEQLRAGRLARMGERLRRQGMLDSASERFADSLALDPDLIAARVGLGRVKLDQEQYDDAMSHFRAALKLQPDSIEASLGIAFVQVARGGDELSQAEETAVRLSETSPSNARLQYLLGLIHHERGRCEQASEAFRRAAELLLK